MDSTKLISLIVTSMALTGCGGGSGSRAADPITQEPPVRIISYDNDNDGVVDATEQVTYERQFKKPTNYQYDSDNDGVWDYLGSYEYDTSGNLLTRSWDTDADGIADLIERRTFDAAANPLTKTYDNDADGNADDIRVFTYNAAGQVLSANRDTDGDGIDDATDTFTYNDDGDKIGQTLDSDADGVLEKIEAWTYSTPKAKATYSVDTDADGTFDDRWYYTYTTDLKNLTLTKDIGLDSVIDYSRVVTYTDFDNGDWEGNILIDNNNDGINDERWVRRYNGDRLLIVENLDNDFDGIFDSGLEYVRNDAGKLTAQRNFRLEAMTREILWTYNQENNQTLRTNDNDGDAIVESRFVTTYENWDIGEITVLF